MFLFWKNAENLGKMTVFPGGYGRIGGISHGRIWPDWGLLVRGPKAILGLNLALASIQCFIVDSIAPESPNSKSAGCKAVTLGEIELFMF